MLSLEGYGVDTMRVTYRVQDGLNRSLPAHDRDFQTDMLGAGWGLDSRARLDAGEVVNSYSFSWQDPGNSTLRLFLRSGEYLAAEFSAPRLLDDSPVNLNLASVAQVGELLAEVGDRAAGLIPETPRLTIQKLNRLDYAVDIAAGVMLPGVISAAGQFRFPGARNPSTHLYPGETATTRTSQFTFRCYAKGPELEAKLSPREKGLHGNIIKLTREKGVTRMELSNRKRGGLSIGSVFWGAADFSERLEAGFNGGVVTIGGLARLEADISALGLSSQRESTLIKFATRYAVLGEDGMKQRYSKATFYRHKRDFLKLGLRLDDICSYEGEIDFRPIIKELRAA